jgi:hypothetical protein
MVCYIPFLLQKWVLTIILLFLDVSQCPGLPLSTPWTTSDYSLDYPLSTLWTTFRLLPFPLFVPSSLLTRPTPIRVLF